MSSLSETLNKDRVAEGKIIAGKSKVVICGLCHNNAKTIPSTIERIELAGAPFKEAAIVIYENNSKDDTVSLLQNYSKIHLVSEEVPLFKPFGSVATRKRAEWMARCRNQYLNVVKGCCADYDYMVVVDMDLASWEPSSILHSISYMNKYDVLSANGLDAYGDGTIYYDTWSLVQDGVLQNNKIRLPYGPTPPFDVDSAFGGLAIYKIPHIIQVSYGTWYDKFGVYGSEHTGLHAALKGIGATQAINPFMVVQR